MVRICAGRTSQRCRGWKGDGAVCCGVSYDTAASKTMVDSRDHDGEWADRQQRSLEREERMIPSPPPSRVCIPRIKVILPRPAMISQLGLYPGWVPRDKIG